MSGERAAKVGEVFNLARCAGKVAGRGTAWEFAGREKTGAPREGRHPGAIPGAHQRGFHTIRPTLRENLFLACRPGPAAPKARDSRLANFRTHHLSCTKKFRQVWQNCVQCREVLECGRSCAAFGEGQLRKTQVTRTLAHGHVAFTPMEGKPCKYAAPRLPTPGKNAEKHTLGSSFPVE